MCRQKMRLKDKMREGLGVSTRCEAKVYKGLELEMCLKTIMVI